MKRIALSSAALMIFVCGSFAGDELPCSPEAASAPLNSSHVRTLSDLGWMLGNLGLKVDLDQLFRDTAPTLSLDQPDSPDRLVRVPVIIHDRSLSEKDFRRISHPEYQAPNDASLLLAFRPSSRFSTKDCGRDQMSFGASVGNSMVIGQQYFKKDGTSRSSKVDSMGQTNEFRVERKLDPSDCVGSITVSARFMRLLGGCQNDPELCIASDDAIEVFHQWRGHDDPYFRKRYGYDHSENVLVDTHGRRFEAHDGEVDNLYELPVRIDYDRYARLYESESAKTTLNTGVQAEVPVAQPFGQLSAGVHANIVHTQEISDRWLATVGAGLTYNIQSSMMGGYDPTDRKMTSTRQSTIAAGLSRIDPDFQGKTTILMTYDRSSPLLNDGDYLPTTARGFAKGEPYTAFLAAQSRAANFSSERAYGLSLIRENKDSTHQFTVKEDANPSLGKTDGNNNQDIFFAYVYRMRFR